MGNPTLFELETDFEDRNMFLQVTLGLLSLCVRYEKLVAEYGLPAEEDSRGGTAGDAVLDFLVGLAAFSQHVLSTLRQVDRTEGAAPQDAKGRRSPSARPALRRLLA